MKSNANKTVDEVAHLERSLTRAMTHFANQAEKGLSPAFSRGGDYAEGGVRYIAHMARLGGDDPLNHLVAQASHLYDKLPSLKGDDLKDAEKALSQLGHQIKNLIPDANTVHKAGRFMERNAPSAKDMEKIGNALEKSAKFVGNHMPTEKQMKQIGNGIVMFAEVLIDILGKID